MSGVAVASLVGLSSFFSPAEFCVTSSLSQDMQTVPFVSNDSLGPGKELTPVFGDDEHALLVTKTITHSEHLRKTRTDLCLMSDDEPS